MLHLFKKFKKKTTRCLGEKNLYPSIETYRKFLTWAFFKRTVWWNDRQTVTLNSVPAGNSAIFLWGRFIDPFITHLSVVKQFNIKAQVKRTEPRFYGFAVAQLHLRRQSSNTKGLDMPGHQLKKAVFFYKASMLRDSTNSKKAFSAPCWW